jgi:alkylhydroperoxidase/carboxymuconolactone decarboxylase family protein YurZ
MAFQCAWCIAVPVKGCVDQSATKEEILEAAMLAVVMGGGPKLMYIKIVL